MAEEQNILAEISEEEMIVEHEVAEDVPRNVPLIGHEKIHLILPDFTDDESTSEEGDVPQNHFGERGRDMPSLSDDDFGDDAWSSDDIFPDQEDLPHLSDMESESPISAGDIPSDDEWIWDDNESLAQGGGEDADVEDEGDEGDVHDFEIDDDIEDSELSESSYERQDDYFDIIVGIPYLCPVARLQTYPDTSVPLLPFFENTPDSSAESN